MVKATTVMLMLFYILDAASMCLMNVSIHNFTPGLLEMVNDLTVIREIVDELFMTRIFQVKLVSCLFVFLTLPTSY